MPAQTIECLCTFRNVFHRYQFNVVITRQVEKDKLVLHLQKAVPRLWAAELDQGGLETDRPEDGADAMM